MAERRTHYEVRVNGTLVDVATDGHADDVATAVADVLAHLKPADRQAASLSIVARRSLGVDPDA